jgi:RNase H-like domain found in reverse transcriptase/Reverse transcriptase (RNA-dependent DNA polymerase)/Integrase zinc binding domain
MRKSGTYKAFL